MVLSAPTSISVLIATRDRPVLLRKCLDSLMRGSRLPDEIVIADQSTGDDTEKVSLQLPTDSTKVRYLRLARRGKSRALNEALRVSTGELLALTDDDVEVDATWIDVLERLARRETEAVAFCGRVLPEPGTDPRAYLNLVLSTEPRWITRKANPMSPGFVGANIAVRRGALVAAGGYNVHFGPGATFVNNDDGELAYRLTHRGGRLLYAPELVVYHSGWRQERETLEQKREYLVSLGAFAGYYLRRGHLRPSAYLAKKGQFKLRQLVRGWLTRNAAAVADARLQLGGMRAGFVRGFAQASEIEESGAAAAVKR